MLCTHKAKLNKCQEAVSIKMTGLGDGFSRNQREFLLSMLGIYLTKPRIRTKKRKFQTEESACMKEQTIKRGKEQIFTDGWSVEKGREV